MMIQATVTLREHQKTTELQYGILLAGAQGLVIHLGHILEALVILKVLVMLLLLRQFKAIADKPTQGAFNSPFNETKR